MPRCTAAADLLAVNPPQRPAALLPDVAEDVLHLHQGGGEDGFAALRLVLANAGTTRVRSTAAALLDLPSAADSLCGTRWLPPAMVAQATLPLDPAWRRLAGDLVDRVGVWEFHRAG